MHTHTTLPGDAWRHGLRLAAASERLVAQLRARLRLSSNEMNVLLLLHDGGACSMTELSRQARILRAATSTLVDRLVGDGWVTRVGDHRDRRRVLVAPTDRFEDALLEVSHAWRQRLRNLASASEAWPLVVPHLDHICDIAATSARELREELTRRDP